MLSFCSLKKWSSELLNNLLFSYFFFPTALLFFKGNRFSSSNRWPWISCISLPLFPDILSGTYSFSNGSKENPCAQTRQTQAHLRTPSFNSVCLHSLALHCVVLVSRRDGSCWLHHWQTCFLCEFHDCLSSTLASPLEHMASLLSAQSFCTSVAGAVGPCARRTFSRLLGTWKSPATICQWNWIPSWQSLAKKGGSIRISVLGAPGWFSR